MVSRLESVGSETPSRDTGNLRHSFASRALALSETLPVIGKLLGHTQVQTTARFAHSANETIKASGSRVGDSIGAHIAPLEPEQAVVGRAVSAGLWRPANTSQSLLRRKR